MTGRNADLVVDQNVFENRANNITAGNVVASLDTAWLEVPLLLSIQSGHVNTTRNVDSLEELRVGEKTISTATKEARKKILFVCVCLCDVCVFFFFTSVDC